MGVTGTEEGNPESHACYRARVPMQRRQRRIAKQRRSTTWRRIADSGTPIRISARGASRVATSCSGQPPLGWRLRSPSGVLRLTDVAAQEATPGTGAPPAAPTSGTEGQTRGAGGELKLLQWQAPTTLNMHLAGSFKDQLAACLVTEPLIHFLPDATPIPCLVTEVPSLENGLRRRRPHDRHLHPAGRDRLERRRAIHRRGRRLHLEMDHRSRQPIVQRRAL